MIARCNNPENQDYKNYGARGISVAQRWIAGDGAITGFECFCADMGDCPVGFTIERLDNSLGYAPGNCVWASREDQSLNRRNIHYIEWMGQKKPRSVWAKEMGIPYFTLVARLKNGWPVERALTEPVN